MGQPPVRAIEARRLKVTPALLANIRRRYEHTDEPISALAADLGCTGQTVSNIAKREGWERYKAPPRDVTPAMLLLEKTERLAESSRGRADSDVPPDPSPPVAALVGGEEMTAQELTAEEVAETAKQLHDMARELLAAVKAGRAQRAGLPESPLDQERTARTISSLTAAINKLTSIRGGVPLAESQTANDYDDMPADLDEFREALAQKIETFLASRPDEDDVAEADDEDTAAALS